MDTRTTQAFNATVDLDGSLTLTPPSNHTDYRFVGWYEYSGGTTTGDVISTHPNFGFSVTKTMSIAPRFEASVPTDGDFTAQWNAYIDRNEISKEMDTATTGTIYNDNIVRFRWGTDSATQFNLADENNECGVVIFAQKSGASAANITAFEGYDDNTMLTVLQSMKNKGITSAKSSSAETYMYYYTASSLSRLNRVNIVQTLSYQNFNGGKYKVMAYIKQGDVYKISSVATGTY